MKTLTAIILGMIFGLFLFYFTYIALGFVFGFFATDLYKRYFKKEG